MRLNLRSKIKVKIQVFLWKLRKHLNASYCKVCNYKEVYILCTHTIAKLNKMQKAGMSIEERYKKL